MTKEATSADQKLQPLGVVILALNHPYYGNYAFQLLLSIKFTAPEIPVCIMHDGVGIGHLDPTKRMLVDHLIEVPVGYRTSAGRPDPIKAKLYAYELSPFKRTIQLDADLLWLPQKTIKTVFDELAPLELAITNRGKELVGKAHDGFIQWAKPSEIVVAHKLTGTEALYNLCSELMYYKKGSLAKKVFTAAQKIYDKPLVNFNLFGLNMPDELALEIALMKTKVELVHSPFLPFYWESFEKKRLKLQLMYQQFYAYSIGGSHMADYVAKTYDQLSQFYCNKFGFRTRFPARQKRTFLPERHLI